ncbi:NUDIX hydrolase, partial [Bacillus sp. B-TM1]
MVPIKDLSHYGFSDTFITLISEGFTSVGSYQGLKRNIGL